MAAPTIAIVPTGTKSVIHNATLKGFELDGDETAPGVDKYYGTDASGVKGYHDQAAAASTTVTTNSGLTGDGSAGDPVGILNSGVTTDRIANMAVTSTKIGTGEVATNNIATDAVTTAKIATDAVGTDALDATGITPGTYTNPTITYDINGRATAAANGSGSTQAFFTGIGIDAGYGIGSGTVVTFQNPGMTVAIPSGEFPKSLIVDLPAGVYTVGGELDITFTHPDGTSPEHMLLILPEVRYIESSTNTGGILDNVAGDSVLANAAGSITVQYTNTNTLAPAPSAMIQFP